MPTTHQVNIGKVVVTTHIFSCRETFNTTDLFDQSLRDLLSNARHEGAKHIVGIDIEKTYIDDSTSFSFHSRLKYVPEKVAALMLCCGNSCLIIQDLYHMSRATLCLSKFLRLQEITFVGVGIKYCLEALEKSCGIICRNAVDLRDLAATVRQDEMVRTYTLADLAVLVTQVFDKDEILRGCNAAALSDWNVGTLSP